MEDDTAMDLLEGMGIANFKQLLKDLDGSGWAEKMAACEVRHFHIFVDRCMSL